MKLAYYSHRDSIVFGPALLDACKSISPPIEVVEWRRDAKVSGRESWREVYDFLVIHGDVDELPIRQIGEGQYEFLQSDLDRLISRIGTSKCEHQNINVRDTIVIFLSSDVLVEQKLLICEEGGRLALLNVHNAIANGLGTKGQMNISQRKACATQWKKFLEALIEPRSLAAFFKDDYLLSNARRINEFVSGPVCLSLLTSTSLLCQGYLAIRAKRYGDSAGHVRDALELMGWYSFLEHDGGKEIVKRGVIDGVKDLLALTDICDHEVVYWNPLKADEALKEAEAEWESIIRGKKQRYQVSWEASSVCKTLMAIQSSSETINEAILADLVARAYLELHELLGGEKYV